MYKYKIIKQKTTTMLTREVNVHLKKEWELVGGICVIQSDHTYGKDGREIKFYQAMTKYE